MRRPGTASATALSSGIVCGWSREKLPTKTASMGRADAGPTTANRSSKPSGTNSEGMPQDRAVSTMLGSAEMIRSYASRKGLGGSGEAISSDQQVGAAPDLLRERGRKQVDVLHVDDVGPQPSDLLEQGAVQMREAVQQVTGDRQAREVRAVGPSGPPRAAGAVIASPQGLEREGVRDGDRRIPAEFGHVARQGAPRAEADVERLIEGVGVRVRPRRRPLETVRLEEGEVVRVDEEDRSAHCSIVRGPNRGVSPTRCSR